MDKQNTKDDCAHGAEMWRDYRFRHGIVAAYIICQRYLTMQAGTNDQSERDFCQQLKEAIQSEPNFKDTPVYLYGEKLAEYNDEMALFNESDRLNRLCASDIDAAIRTCEYGDGTHNFDYALEALTARYGLERVRLVLAAEAKWLGFAERGISDDNYQWARGLNLGEQFYGGFHLRTQTADLDEFISGFRKEEIEINTNKTPSKEIIKRLREQYLAGTRVELISMDDPYSTLKPGDKGLVSGVDDIGTILVDWDSGSKLGIAYGADSCRVIENTFEQGNLPAPEKKLICFIDSKYNELFKIPDGESIRITYPPDDGREPVERQCKYNDECHFTTVGRGGNLYHICQFAEIMERLGAHYEPVNQLRNVELAPFTAGEDKFYLPNKEKVSTAVGIMSGNFGNNGDRFHSNWTRKEINNNYTPEVQSEIQCVVYALRQNLLKNHESMLAYCKAHPEARLPESANYAIYGFKLETDSRQYFIRCFVEQDSRFSIYAYADKPTPSLEQAAPLPSAVKPEAAFSFGEVLPGTADEGNMFYKNDAAANLHVGYLRGDFGSGGKQFFNSWFENDSSRNTPEFKAEFQTVVDSLRKNVLKDISACAAYCHKHPEARIPSRLSGSSEHYGFKVETESRQYFIRCTPRRNDYFYIYAYDKQITALEQTKAAKETASVATPGKGCSSVMKAIEYGKKTPKPPRKRREPAERGKKSEEL